MHSARSWAAPDTVRVLTGKPGAEALLQAVMAAPDHAAMDFRLGYPEGTTRKYVIGSVDGVRVALTTAETRAVADAAEAMLHRFPHDPKTVGFPNLILGLRAAADMVDDAGAPPTPVSVALGL